MPAFVLLPHLSHSLTKMPFSVLRPDQACQTHYRQGLQMIWQIHFSHPIESIHSLARSGHCETRFLDFLIPYPCPPKG